MKVQITTLAVFIVAMGVFYLLGHPKQNTDLKLLITDSYSTGSVYRNIEIKDTAITYTFAPDGRKPSGSAGRFAKDDLKTVSGKLTSKEHSELVVLIAQTGFMGLDSHYGNKADTKAYPEKIAIRFEGKTKDVTYQGPPKSSMLPGAFSQIRDKLSELARNDCRTSPKQ